jgi:hypothetical protein
VVVFCRGRRRGYFRRGKAAQAGSELTTRSYGKRLWYVEPSNRTDRQFKQIRSFGMSIATVGPYVNWIEVAEMMPDV